MTNEQADGRQHPAEQTTPPTTFRGSDDLPLLYRCASHTSLTAQHRFLLALRLRLGGLLGAVAGAALPACTVAGINVGGLIALVSFAVALAAELYVAITRPERTWYEGRAVAESVKTLAWRYMVRGESFEDIDDPEADRILQREITGILNGVDLELGVVEATGPQVTEAMRAVRRSDYQTRRQIYLEQRIRDQEEWYSRKQAWNAQRGHRWLITTIMFEFLGLLGGAVWAFADVSFDFIGVFAAFAATITAWVQAKQYQTLATAYGITTQELGMVLSEAELVTSEAGWADFVGESEEAISREHTLWRASRGLRVRPIRHGERNLR